MPCGSESGSDDYKYVSSTLIGSDGSYDFSVEKLRDGKYQNLFWVYFLRGG